MKNKLTLNLLRLSIILFSATSLPLWADSTYPCLLRFMKTNCWKGHQITVQAIDTGTQKNIGDPVVLTKDSFEIDVDIPCQPNQSISFTATTLPAVWGSSATTSYPSTHFWQSPKGLPPKATQWVVSLCFASDFSSVPLPLTAEANCQCNFKPLANSAVSVSEALGK